MSYDRNNIDRTTEDGINDLINDIIGGFVPLERAFAEIKFKPLQKKISKALELRDDEDWAKVCEENNAESYSNYLASYNRGNFWYRGKHIEEANNNLSILTKSIEDIDEEAWLTASSEDTIESYKSYLAVYDKTAPDYVGKYVNEAKSSLNSKLIKKQDETDWQVALTENSEDGYNTYLSKYTSEYVGAHVAEALQYLRFISEAKKEKAKAEADLAECKLAWETSKSLNTIQSYQEFIYNYKATDNVEIRALITQAENQILSLQDDEDWHIALKTNTQKGYNKYIAKYESLKSEYQGKYLDKANSWIPGRPNPRPKYIAILCAVALVVLGIIFWRVLTKEKAPIPLTDEEVTQILAEYTDSLKQDLFDGFYLAPVSVYDVRIANETANGVEINVESSNDEIDNSLYSREDVINRFMLNNGKFIVKNRNGETINLPEADNGVDSICVKDSPFFEYIDNNGLRRVVALYKDGLYYYMGECGSHDGIRQFILANEDNEFGLIDIKKAELRHFEHEKIAISSSGEGFFIKNGNTFQNYNFAGNALDPEQTTPKISTTNASNATTVERHYGNTKLKDYFKDQSGRIIATFEEISYSSVNGFYKVKGANNLYGIYDSKNRKLAVPTIYEDVSVYGHSTNLFPAKKNGKWGYVQYGGTEKIGFTFKEAYSFNPSTKLAVVKNDDSKCGYINIEGKYKIQPQYYSAGTMTSDGARVMKSSDEYGYINTNGTVIASWYPYMGTEFVLNRIMVQDKNKLRGFVDRQNKLVIPYIFDSDKSYTFDEKTHLCKVSYNGVEWYINSNGAFACPVNDNPANQNISQQIIDAKAEAERQKKEKEEKVNKKKSPSDRNDKTSRSIV